MGLLHALRRNRWGQGLAVLLLVVPTQVLAQESAPPRPRLTPRLVPRPPASRPPAAPPAAPASEPAAPPSQGPPPSAVPPSPVPPAQPALAFAPPALPYVKNVETPPGYVEKRSFNNLLLVGGAVTFGLSYVGSLIYAGAKKDEQFGVLAVPLVGPWIALGKRDFQCEVVPTLDIDESVAQAEECNAKLAKEVAIGGVLAGLGLGQMLGAFALTGGLLDRKKLWVRQDLAGVSLEIEPRADARLTGMVIHGQF